MIEHWESRNISAEALQSMRDISGRRSWSGDGSGSAAGASSSSVASVPKVISFHKTPSVQSGFALVNAYTESGVSFHPTCTTNCDGVGCAMLLGTWP